MKKLLAKNLIESPYPNLIGVIEVAYQGIQLTSLKMFQPPLPLAPDLYKNQMQKDSTQA